ncbi:MAG: ABC transporter ATP-binding protein [Candidatus Ventricola sp.]
MIEIRSLCAGYRGRSILTDVSLDFRPGEVLVLLGPNGCGKSTLLKAALGLIGRQSGEVLYDGVPIERLSRRDIARKAAFLTQSRSTPVITALRMVLHGRFPYLSYPRQYSRRDMDIAREALAQVGAQAYQDMNVTELSGGQRQSVYLAMALAQGSQTLLMDEPTTYLDVQHQLSVMRMARAQAGQGKAVVLVLHDIAMALRTADRIAVMNGGRVEALGTPDAIERSGVVDRVFGVSLQGVDTPHGRQYYCLSNHETEARL